MDNETEDMSETDGEISAPRGCDAWVMGVELGEDLSIRACVHCSHTTRGQRTDYEAAGLVFEALDALADIREVLWPIANRNASWSPDTIDEIARRLDFLRTGPNCPAADPVRYSGSVRIELTYQDSDALLRRKVIVDGHTYSVCVGPPAIGYGPGLAYDSPEAYGRAARAALSFAAADLEWGDGCDIGWGLARACGAAGAHLLLRAARRVPVQPRRKTVVVQCPRRGDDVPRQPDGVRRVR